MRKDLPVRPSLEHLKSQAKDLLDAFRRQEPQAFERIRQSLPSAHGADDARIAALAFALHDAQSVVAREYGFDSFADLKSHVELLVKVANEGPQPMSPEALRALMERQVKLPLPDEVQQTLLTATTLGRPREVSLANAFPLIPLRNALLPMHAAGPLQIARPSTIAAVRAAERGDKLLAIFSQKDGATETPTPDDLHPVGTIAELLLIHPAGGAGLWVVVRAIHWVRLESIDASGPHPAVKVGAFAIDEHATEEVKALEKTLREKVRAYAETLPDAEAVLQLTSRLSALELADLTLANLPASVEDKARYASEPSLAGRLSFVLALFDRAA